MDYDSNKKEYHIAVRDFISCRTPTGSLQFSQNFSANATQDAGQALHLSLQQEFGQMFSFYQAEVPISYRFEIPEFNVFLSGRMDGLYEEGGGVLIEEIKTCYSVRRLERELHDEPNHPYILQLKTYAWLYYLNYGIRADLRLLLVSWNDPSKRSMIPILWEEAEMQTLLQETLEALKERRREAIEMARHRKGLSQTIAFPFDPVRNSQQELIDAVERNVRRRGQLLVQAPTGLGKTAAVFYPTLKQGLAENRQVFYVTPKNSQHQVAGDFIKALRDKDHKVSGVVISSKEKVCLKDETICNPDYCEYARDYYDKIAKHKLLQEPAKRGLMKQEDFFELAQEHKVCPFELSLDCSLKADAIICDYNYVFSPTSTLQRYFGEQGQRAVHLVVDEAHNLYTRAQDYFSPALEIPEILDIMTDMQMMKKKFAQKFIDFTRELIDIIEKVPLDTEVARENRLRDSCVVEVPFEVLQLFEKRLGRLMAEYAESIDYLRPSDPAVRFANLVGDFTAALRQEELPIRSTLQNDDMGKGLQLTCCDAADWLRLRLRQCASVTAFSATVKPFEFYRRLSGFGEACESQEFTSVFPRENRKTLILPRISTSFKNREQHYANIAEILNRAIPQKRGHYLIFFPSYSFLENVAPFLNFPGFRFEQQVAGMAPEERQHFIDLLNQTQEDVVICAVQGGVFSEGIDIPGNKIAGVAIIGPPLPPYNLEQELLSAYYEEKYGQGFSYAYVYPAMSKVIQAAGRVIRSEKDRGLVLLLDRRFLEDKYFSIMPDDWYEDTVAELISQDLEKDVADFWDLESE